MRESRCERGVGLRGMRRPSRRKQGFCLGRVNAGLSETACDKPSVGVANSSLFAAYPSATSASSPNSTPCPSWIRGCKAPETDLQVRISIPSLTADSCAALPYEQLPFLQLEKVPFQRCCSAIATDLLGEEDEVRRVVAEQRVSIRPRPPWSRHTRPGRAI